MKLIVGLGNPGKEYNLSRHNVGVLFIHQYKNLENFEVNKHVYASVMKLTSKNVLVARPLTFMNESGKAVKALVDYFKIPLDDLIIIHDDLDLRLGEYKIQKGVGPKLHNGIESVENSLGTKDFWRVRIGVDNRNPENRTPGEAYVLQDFTKEELAILNEVFNKIKNEKNFLTS